MITSAPRTKILVADVPEVAARFERLLAGHEVVTVRTCYDAMSALRNDDFGLVVVGVHFDESRMFGLLADIRTHARYRKVPIVCVLGSQGRLSDVAIEGLDHAVKAMTANGFLNLANFADDDAGNGRVRRIIDYLILIDGDLQQVARKVEEEQSALAGERRTSERRAG